MTLGLRLDVRQTQNLVLTPQLQQAIKLLQLSNLELSTVVERELVDNPFLTRGEDGSRGAQAPQREQELDGAPALRVTHRDAEDGWAPPPTAMAADQRLRVSRSSSGPRGDSEPPFDARLTRALTLADHLREQLPTVSTDKATLGLARALADFLEEDGYLRDSDAALAEQLGAPVELIGAARKALQQCDPLGIAARDLAECLAIQLADRDRLDPAMQAMLENLPLVAHADFPGLQRICGVDLEDVREMILEIKQLDPRPGLSFAPAEPVEAIPDILVSRTLQGTWRIELNDATLPRVLVDRAYYGQVTGHGGSRPDREFLSERYQAASWLVKALDQRSRTLIKVSEAIFERQSRFLDGGPHHLRPLVLRDIAEATGLHESTVSRATADKFVATPRGTFPMRYFFTTAIAGTSGEETHSAEAIRQQIRRMIDGENAINVLSDDQIVEVLKGMGVAIARRTVAKYRESLGIPSSVQRRRSKALSI
jgi:RNA polymerase sigma-54 factor